MVVRELFAKLGLDVNAQSFVKGQLAVEGIKLGLQAMVGVAKAALDGVLDLAKGSIDYASEVHDTSQAIGVTTDALQELRHAALLSGLGADELTMSVRLLAQHMAAAKKGGGEAAETFNRLGVKVKDADGKLRPADEVIGDLAAKFSTLPDGPEKTALALQLFGRAGAKMVPLLNEGSESIAAMRQEARDLGLVLGKETVDEGEALGDALDRLKGAFRGIKIAIGTAFFPALKQVTNEVIAWVKANKVFIGQRLGQVIGGLGKTLYVLGKAAAYAFGVFKFLINNWQALAGIVAFIATVVAAANASMVAAFLATKAAAIASAAATAAAWIATAAPFAAVAAAVAGLLLLFDDIRVYRAGGKSLLGEWEGTIKKWLEPQANDPWWLAAIKEFYRLLLAAIKSWDEFKKELSSQNVGTVLEKLKLPGPLGKAQEEMWRLAGIQLPEAPSIPGTAPTMVRGGDFKPTLQFQGPTDKSTVDYAYERLEQLWEEKWNGKMEEALPSVR